MTAKEFTEVYMPLEESFYRVAYYMLESQDDAQDAVQDLYVKLWNSLDSLDTVNSPKAYGLMILRNLCIDRIRKTERHPKAELKDDAAGFSDSMTEIIQKEALERTLKEIRKLPPGQREILRMKVFEELSYEEISQKTGISNLSLRVTLSQIRKKLKNRI